MYSTFPGKKSISFIQKLNAQASRNKQEIFCKINNISSTFNTFKIACLMYSPRLSSNVDSLIKICIIIFQSGTRERGRIYLPTKVVFSENCQQHATPHALRTWHTTGIPSRGGNSINFVIPERGQETRVCNFWQPASHYYANNISSPDNITIRFRWTESIKWKNVKRKNDTRQITHRLVTLKFTRKKRIG